MTRSQYLPYFHQILIDTGKVFVKEIGTFSLIRTNATFGPSKAFISPPATKVSLTNGVYEGESLSDALHEAGIDMVNATKIENSFTSDYKAAKDLNIQFDMLPFGTIDNGILTVNNKFFNKYEGLTDIETAVLPHNVERAYVQKTKMAHEPISLKNIPEYKSSWLDFLIPLLLVASVMTVIFVWYQSSKMLIPHSEMKAQYAIKPAVTRYGTKTMSNNQILNEVDSMLSNHKSPVIDKKPLNSAAPKSAESKLKVNSLQNEGIKPIIVRTKKTPIKSIDTDSVKKGKSQDCVIVVGSFKEAKNAKRLMDKLTTKGYHVYTEKNKGLQRVGVSYDCKEKDSEVFKKEIRNSLNPDAWKLKDSI